MLAKYFWRGIHIVTSAIFIFCSLFLTYSVFYNYEGDLDNFAGFIILTESISFIGNGNKCPLRKFHRKYEKDEELVKVLIPGKAGNNLLMFFTTYTICIFFIWATLEFVIK
ncbi:hypothetical protein COU58_02385 [Candidatus Pacearchaeota archaeon CG10_big_fil_rev_8_21_14_0_10_32_42]|nr:MAG: hypothetical protein COU58_02385 [Candidatus Pacearchaeota archaeon CG10_big_fil_rev_8_21_14_0_10_32_42]